MPLPWADVEVATGWNVANVLGVYGHEGRVFVEGTFYNNTFSVVGSLVGTIPAGYRPSVFVDFTVWTNSSYSQNPNPPQATMRAWPDGRLVIDGLIRPDALDYQGTIHASWPLTPLPDEPTLAAVGGMQMSAHNNRNHLGGGTFVEDTHHAGILCTNLPATNKPSPLDRQFFVDSETLLRPIECFVFLTGGTTSGNGWIQAGDVYINGVTHITVDGDHVGAGADYGSWNAPDFQGPGEDISLAGESANDTGKDGYIFINHNVWVSAGFPDTGAPTVPPNPPPNAPGSVALHVLNGFDGCIYYKRIVEVYDGYFHKNLYRCNAPGDFTLIHSEAAASVADVADGGETFLYMRMDVFKPAVWDAPLPGAAPGADLVFHLFSSASFYTVVSQTLDPALPIRRFVTNFTTSQQGVSTLTPGTGWREGSVPFEIRRQTSGGLVAGTEAVTGQDFGPVDGAGWHLADVDPPDGLMDFGEPNGGVVPLDEIAT